MAAVDAPGTIVREDRSAPVSSPGAAFGAVEPLIQVPDADIYLVGGGMRFPNDLTLEGLSALMRCARVFGAPPVDLRDFGVPAMEDLGAFYSPEVQRKKTYRMMADAVLGAATERRPIGFFTYGSPVVGVKAAHTILSEAPHHDLGVHVCNAPSFLEAIWAELNLEPFQGAQIWLAQSFLDKEVEPCVDATLVLAQATVVGIAHQQREGDVGDLVALRNRLLRFYPPTHLVLFLRADSFAGPPVQYWLRLEDLADHRDASAPTLIVPANPARRPGRGRRAM